MVIFKRNNQTKQSDNVDFGYLKPETYYLDSACQTLRPLRVIEAEKEYYTNFNACGHRVKYEWGEIVDKKVNETRELILKLVGKNSSKYCVVFTLNTTYGINLILHQIDPKGFERVVTSEIEHNSCFLPSITYSKKNNLKRIVLKRELDGSVIYSKEDLVNSIVLLNTTSNIDGRELKNIKELEKDVHENNSLLLLDSAQTLGHNPNLLKDVNFDAIFSSSHKMYGPSLGFIVLKKELIKKLDRFFIGGGTITDVNLDSYDLINDSNDIHESLEAGLQNFAGIIGLGEAIKWRNSLLNPYESERLLSQYMFNGLKSINNINLVNTSPTSTISIYSDKIDSHRLAIFLSEKDIMCRSGYFCCNYYLDKVKQYPPLLRISMGVNNTKGQIDFLLNTLEGLVK